MICQDCRNGYHEGCPKGTWCDCQHRPQRKTLTELVADGTLATEADVHRAALVELTRLAQEMGLE